MGVRRQLILALVCTAHREQQQEQLRGTVVQQRIDERQERRMAANSYGTLRRTALLCVDAECCAASVGTG